MELDLATIQEGDQVITLDTAARLAIIKVEDSFAFASAGLAAQSGSLEYKGIQHGAEAVKEILLQEFSVSIAQGTGALVLTGHGHTVAHVKLEDQTMTLSSANLLGFNPACLTWSLQHNSNLSVARGATLVDVHLQGSGDVLYVSHGGPALKLSVSPERPLTCDPAVVVGWFGDVKSSLQESVAKGTKELVGKAITGDFIMAQFSGVGVVLLQPKPHKDALTKTRVARGVVGNLSEKLPFGKH
eukprot:TRINITY_DN14030_c0_g1_i1.p1 TRINITY_DN14030_c0_g1~~TRINITY_DN14030_c0_g1_i1.p1  ORF type:complete len:243 (+),score=3.13 TRINITY_DN14030_c0_g1_i1:39-767(+)